MTKYSYFAQYALSFYRIRELSIMKKVICLLAAVMLCVSMVGVAFADEAEFVPSISYKGNPDIVEIEDENGDPAIGTITDEEGNVVDYIYKECLVITPVSQANTSTKIPPMARDTLLSVYDQLSKGTMKLPYAAGIDGDKMVIRDLFDVSWLCEEHPIMLEPKGVTLTLTFDIGVEKDVDVVVMTYKNGAWGDIVSVKNNGDGTVSCEFEDFCPVVFATPSPDGGASDTGDHSNVMLWGVLLAVSAAAVVVLVIVRRRDFLR